MTNPGPTPSPTPDQIRRRPWVKPGVSLLAHLPWKPSPLHRDWRLREAGSVNDQIAVWGTGAFSSMWCFYVFFLYGFLPLIKPGWQNTLLYWSNSVQLWALPLIGVGTVVLGRSMNRRADETHDTVITAHAEQTAFIAEMAARHSAEMKAMQDAHDETLAEHREVLDAINRRLDAA